MKTKALKFYKYYMAIIGTAGQCANYIQAYKVYVTKSAQDLSMLAILLASIAITSWLIYGFFIKDYPIIISNIIGFIGAILLVAGIILYG